MICAHRRVTFNARLETIWANIYSLLLDCCGADRETVMTTFGQSSEDEDEIWEWFRASIMRLTNRSNQQWILASQ
jgi:hypothetical protein